jgi:hypothetical protein
MTIWVASGNTTERALMVAALVGEGFEARGFETPADLVATLSSGLAPRVLVLDPGRLDFKREAWEAVKGLAPDALTVLILGANSEPLDADHILRRPLSIGDLANKIKKIVGGVP